ncbi:MAG TPA: LytTR family DNA-binding domain-containing protein [Vicinamibacterales bacterium]|nr:LytTR family DNA-binding domain-containing protein [Vicinamibacterales bacterium]
MIRLFAQELLEQVDPQQFVRIHRSIIVNLKAEERDVLGRTEIHLKSHKDVLPVSRAFAGQFKTMERLACLAIRPYRLR